MIRRWSPLVAATAAAVSGVIRAIAADHGDHRVAVLLAEPLESTPDQTHGRLSWFGYWPAASSRRSAESVKLIGEFGIEPRGPAGR